MDICRTCCENKNELNKIFVSSNKSLKCSKVLFKATGLKIKLNDGFPQMMCNDCINFINQYLAFRRKCKESYKILIGLTKIKTEPYSDLIQNNDKDYVLDEQSSNPKPSFTDNNAINKKYLDNNINSTKNYKKAIVDDKQSCLIKNNVKEKIASLIDNINDSTDDFNDTAYNNYDCNVTVTVDRTGNSLKNGIMEFEATIEDILRKPKDIVFENKELKKNIQLDYKKVCEDKKEEIRKVVTKREEKDEPVECKYCRKLVKSKHALNIHYKTHTGRNIVCEHCGKKFISKRRLLIHCRGRHGYKKTDKCKYCDYRGSCLEMVKIHERLHTGERPYVCACGAAFTRRSSHLQHAATHRLEKTVPCDECPALFKSVTLMKIHKNRHKTRRRRQIAAADHQTVNS